MMMASHFEYKITKSYLKSALCVILNKSDTFSMITQIKGIRSDCCHHSSGGVKIVGLDYVTVNVPSSVVCKADCASSCTYSVALDGQTAQGQGSVLAFTVNRWVEAISVTCTVTDDKAKTTTTATKQLQVLGAWIGDICVGELGVR